MDMYCSQEIRETHIIFLSEKLKIRKHYELLNVRSGVQNFQA